MTKELTCIACPMGCALKVQIEGEQITVTGNTCKRGEVYGIKEVTAPTRIVTSQIPVLGGNIPCVSVKTASDIPKEMIPQCMGALKGIRVKAPVHIGDVIISDIGGTGVEIIATKNVQCM